MDNRRTFFESIFWVYLFSGFGLICIFGIWPWLKDIGFFVAGILLNVLALTFWLKVVKPKSAKSVDES